MLFRNLGNNDQPQTISWHDLEFGAPTIIGFASLCSRALVAIDPNAPSPALENLSDEAKAILVSAQNRGSMDIRASREPFDSAQRFLAVCVEYELDQRLLFLQKQNPQQTVKFLEGFRELCQNGLIMHHLQKDFSLSAKGFELAGQLEREDFENLLSFAIEIEH